MSRLLSMPALSVLGGVPASDTSGATGANGAGVGGGTGGTGEKGSNAGGDFWTTLWAVLVTDVVLATFAVLIKLAILAAYPFCRLRSSIRARVFLTWFHSHHPKDQGHRGDGSAPL